MTASRRRFLKTAAVAGAGGAIAGAPAIVRSQQVTTWRCQTLWSSAELTQRCFEDFCERVKVGSNGRLVIQPFAAGAVTGVFETLDAVTAGVLQAQASWPGYWTGKDAGLAVISDFVFGYQHPWQAEAWFYHRGGLQMLRAGVRQVQRLPGRRELVGRRVDRVEEADRADGGLQGRQVPLAAGHDRRDPDQARGVDRRAARRRGVLGARQGRGRRRRLGDALDEPAHGLPRHREVPDQAVPLDADPGVHGQHGRLEEAAPRPPGVPRHRGARVDVGPGPAHRRRRPARAEGAGGEGRRPGVRGRSPRW